MNSQRIGLTIKMSAIGFIFLTTRMAFPWGWSKPCCFGGTMETHLGFVLSMWSTSQPRRDELQIQSSAVTCSEVTTHGLIRSLSLGTLAGTKKAFAAHKEDIAYTTAEGHGWAERGLSFSTGTRLGTRRKEIKWSMVWPVWFLRVSRMLPLCPFWGWHRGAGWTLTRGRNAELA